MNITRTNTIYTTPSAMSGDLTSTMSVNIQKPLNKFEISDEHTVLKHIYAHYFLCEDNVFKFFDRKGALCAAIPNTFIVVKI